jgi:hypothetical protein
LPGVERALRLQQPHLYSSQSSDKGDEGHRGPSSVSVHGRFLISPSLI